MNEYPLLKRLSRSYLHQDFELEFGDADCAVRAFFEQIEEADRRGAEMELNSLLSEHRSEEALRRLIFDELGCAYYYLADWPNSVTWLEHLQEMLREK